MTVYDQLQRALTAEGIDGSLKHGSAGAANARRHGASVHPANAVWSRRTAMAGKRRQRGFGNPFLSSAARGRGAPVQLSPARVNESSQAISGIGHGANIWRGYGRNTRGVISSVAGSSSPGECAVGQRCQPRFLPAG